MVLIDFLKKTIPGGGAKNSQGGKKNFRASREILPPLAKILCTRLYMKHKVLLHRLVLSIELGIVLTGTGKVDPTARDEELLGHKVLSIM